MLKKFILSIAVYVFIISFWIIWAVQAYDISNKDKLIGNYIVEKFQSEIDGWMREYENIVSKINIISFGLDNINPRLATILKYIGEQLRDNQQQNKIKKVEVRLIDVIDGDTIEVLYRWKERSVRFIGIDAPESSLLRYGKRQCFGKQSSDYLKNLLAWARKIRLEFDGSQWKLDKYGRLLAYVWYNNTLINHYLIQQWYAREYTFRFPYKYQSLFQKTEKRSKKKSIWLWNPLNCSHNNKQKNLQCKNKRYCKDMHSCDEAKYYLHNCWLTTLDGDNDWVPCENLCS